MPLLNSFRLGADPEFSILSNTHLVQYTGPVPPWSPWGLDHSGWVIEPHPKPEKSVRELFANIQTCLNDFALRAPVGKWRSGAHIVAPERQVSLGGHVHVDLPRCSDAQKHGLDLFTQHLEALDILPGTECVARRGVTGGYGRYGDVRTERGHFEYRTYASWLFSQRATKLCLLGTKLVVVDPAAPEEVLGPVLTASIPKLKAFFERFQNQDDDVDWILGSKLFSRKLDINPDRDLKEVWKVEPKAEDPHWKRLHAETNLNPVNFPLNAHFTSIIGYLASADRTLTGPEVDVMRDILLRLAGITSWVLDDGTAVTIWGRMGSAHSAGLFVPWNFVYSGMKYSFLVPRAVMGLVDTRNVLVGQIQAWKARRMDDIPVGLRLIGNLPYVWNATPRAARRVHTEL